MASSRSSRSHVSSHSSSSSSFLSLWPSALFGRSSDPQEQDGARNEATESQNETSSWRSRGLGTISPWANVVPTIIVPDVPRHAPIDPSSLSDPRQLQLSPSWSRPMPERNADKDDAYGHDGTSGPSLRSSEDETSSVPVMTHLLESTLGDGHLTTSGREGEGTEDQTSSGTLMDVNMTLSEAASSGPTLRRLRKPRPRSYAGERIPLSTFLAQRSLLEDTDEDMALVVPAPHPPTLDVIGPAVLPTFVHSGEPSTTSLSRNPSSSTNASSHTGPSTDDSHLPTPFEPAIIETPPSFGQLWDLMDRAKAYPFTLQLDKEPVEPNAKRDLDEGNDEGGSKEDSLTQMNQKIRPLDEFNDFGPNPTSPHFSLAGASINHSSDYMAAVATLAPAPSFSKLPISTHSSDTDLSSSSYFTAKPFSATRTSSTDRRTSSTKLKSASSDDLVYHAITHDEGEGSPGKQRTTHRPTKRRESPPSAFRRPDLPLPPSHLPYSGPFDAYTQESDDGKASGSTSADTSSSAPWIALSPQPLPDLQLVDPRRTPALNLSRTNSLSLRPASQPPRLIRSLTAPRKGHRSRSASPRVEAVVDSRPEESGRPQRPPILPRSESFRRVFRRWSNRSATTLDIVPPVPHHSKSDPHSAPGIVPEVKPYDLQNAAPSPERKLKKASSATSVSNRLKKQRSIDDAKGKSSDASHAAHISLPRTSSLNAPPRAPPPRSSSIPILIPARTTSLSISRKAVVSWAPSPRGKTLPGIAEASSSARGSIVINDDLSAEFGRGSASQLSKSERYRRCQSLVDINDDHLFKQMVEELPAFDAVYDLSRSQSESNTGSSIACGQSAEEMGDMISADQAPIGDTGGIDADGAVLMTRSKSLPGSSESRARKDHVSAWFVTREIVQGEKRYGRLLAKGVAVLDVIVRQSSGTSPTGHTLSPSSPSRARFSNSHAHPPELDPLDILSSRLPRLLSLSASLSALFDLQPSPSGISSAFVSLETVLIEQLGAWASEIGTLLVNGLSEVLDVSISALSTPGASRSSSFGTVEELDQDERLSFADIVIMPVQRALRYKLLFQDLLSKVPPSTQVHTLVSSALMIADKIAAECNTRQVVDVSAFRRRPTGSSTKSVSIVEDSPSKLNKPDPRAKRRSMGRDKDRIKKSHTRGSSVSSTKTIKEDTTINTTLTAGSIGRSSGAQTRPKAKRRISAGPMGLNTAESPSKKDRSSWSLF